MSEIKEIQVTLCPRSDTKTNWETKNYTLEKNEIGIDTTSHNFKVGDGTTKWNSLPYYITKTTATTTATTTADGLMSKGDKSKLDGIDENATRVIESTVSGWGFTKNVGTVTSVKINGVNKTPTSGVVDLGTVLTSHQSIKKLKTDNTTAQTTSASEDIVGSGTISLHKVSKTGSYNDLNDKPTIPSKVTDLSDASNYATTTQLGNYLPLSGGTLTGTLNSKTINVKGANATLTLKNVSANIDYAKIETPSTRALHLQAPDNTYLVIGDKTYSTDRTNKYKLIVNGTSKINGLMTMVGNIIPNATNTYDLGDATHYWGNIYGLELVGENVTVGEQGTLFIGKNEITASVPANSIQLELPSQSGIFALKSEITSVVVTDLTSI